MPIGVSKSQNILILPELKQVFVGNVVQASTGIQANVKRHTQLSNQRGVPTPKSLRHKIARYNNKNFSSKLYSAL